MDEKDWKDAQDRLQGGLEAMQKRRAPYPFCCHPEICIDSGRCERRVNGELQCCAD